MFKKDQSETSPTTHPRPGQTSSAKPQPAPRGGGSAVIGASISVKGDVSGDEDLVILGRVEGTVNLTQNIVTIGPSGKVKADVRGKMVIVEGEIEGDLKAGEQIILRNTAKVEGSISAPRVALEDGAVFRGGIEMDSSSSKGPAAQPAAPAPVGGTGGKAAPNSTSSASKSTS
jgi:cytoskeletal protein CcmA (bactofilin family)